MNEVHIHLLAKTEARRLYLERHLLSKYAAAEPAGAGERVAALAQRAGRGLGGMLHRQRRAWQTSQPTCRDRRWASTSNPSRSRDCADGRIPLFGRSPFDPGEARRL
jgi:hypothetical protein